MSGKTSIYAVARDVQSDSPQSRYQKPQTKWTVMVEAHQLLGIGKAEVVEYCATWDDKAGHQRVHPLDLGSHDSIVGSILVSDSSHASQKKVSSVFEKAYKGKISNLNAESTSEEWLKHALHTLQEHKLVESFEIADLMTFMNAYIANRHTEGNEAPATIAYPPLHSDHDKKAKKHGFWMSYPETKSNRSGEKIYGGLM